MSNENGVGLFVQVVLTQPQAALIHAVLGHAELQGELPEWLASEMAGLVGFFQDIAERPSAYPVTGRMARSIKTRLRRA